jgi:hypothetical protein
MVFEAGIALAHGSGKREGRRSRREEALMQYVARIAGRSLFACVAAIAIGLGIGSAKAELIFYQFDTLIPVPASPDNQAPGGAFTTYDISFFDANTQMYYLGDRSNASVDVFSAATNSFVGRVGGSGGLFSGIQPSLQAPNNDISGPNGVLVVNQPGQHVLWAGNGDSTLKAFNLAAPGSPQIANIATGTPDQKRVDEMAFSPTFQRLAVANNAADTPFLTLVNTTTNTVAQQIFFNGANGTPKATNGIEQAVWDPQSQKFYLSIPQINGTGAGGVAVINAANGQIEHVFNLTTDFGVGTCSPAGLAVGGSGSLMIGCGVASQSILLDPKGANGKGTIKVFSQVSGEDEVWYDPKTHNFLLAARLNPGGPVLGVINDTLGAWLENLPTTPGDHSVSCDPVSGECFVPYGGIAGNDICPNGCIGVFRLVPEPSALPIMSLGLMVLGGLTWYRRRRPS